MLERHDFYKKGEDLGFQSMAQESSQASKILTLLAIPNLPPPQKIQRVINRISTILSLECTHPFEITVDNVDFVLATLWIIAEAHSSANMAHPPVDIKSIVHKEGFNQTARDLIGYLMQTSEQTN